MHELPVTRSILDVVLRHAEANQVEKVVAVNLRIGALSDLEPEWLQSYFDRLSRGTVAEGARLRVTRERLTFLCRDCGREFDAAREDLDSARCLGCDSRDASVTSGVGYLVESMEAQ